MYAIQKDVHNTKMSLKKLFHLAKNENNYNNKNHSFKTAVFHSMYAIQREG